MKTKDLIKKIEVETINNEESTYYVKDIMYLFIKKLFTNLLILLTVLILAILLIDKVSILSFVDPKFYVTILTSFGVLESLLFFIMFGLYIYKERKNRFKENFKLKKLLKAYKHVDLISYILNVIAVVYFLAMFVLTPAQVSGNSMNDTYEDGDRVLVWHMFYEAKRDDVVIIEVNDNLVTDRFSLNGAEMIIKRVVASPKDKVTYNPLTQEFLVNEKVVMDNISYDQYITMLTYKPKNKVYADKFSTIVPDDYYIVLGDNRPDSLDSRYIGLIPKENIIGKSVLRVYPFRNFGFPNKKIKFERN